MYRWFWKSGRLFFFFAAKPVMGHFEGAETFLTLNCPESNETSTLLWQFNFLFSLYKLYNSSILEVKLYLQVYFYNWRRTIEYQGWAHATQGVATREQGWPGWRTMWYKMWTNAAPYSSGKWLLGETVVCGSPWTRSFRLGQIENKYIGLRRFPMCQRCLLPFSIVSHVWVNGILSIRPELKELQTFALKATTQRKGILKTSLINDCTLYTYHCIIRERETTLISSKLRKDWSKT
jgi:hypothetical protein